MAYLDCSVKSCTYNNEDGCCCKGDIQVEGREATEAQSTCCGSFKDRGTNGAACNALRDVSKEIDVACEAAHCRFNENGFGIGMPLALSILKGQGGDIDVDFGGRGEGTTFILKFFK